MQATTTAAARKVSFESVAAAAESLTTNGQRPSVRAVIAAMGGGSPNAVLPHLQAWKAARPAVKTADVALDPRIVTILAEQITTSVIEATRAAEARAADLEADAEAVADAGRLAEARADELAGELVSVQSDNQQQAGRLDALTHEIEQVKKEAGAAVADARADALRERETGEQVRQALARAELRLEAVPAMEITLAALRDQLDAERTARTLAEKAAAVAIAEQHAAERRADDLKGALEHARAELRGQQAQTAAAQAEAGEARKAAAAAREETANLRGQVVQQTVQAGAKKSAPTPAPVPVLAEKAPTRTRKAPAKPLSDK